jgi:hypothetical protein
MSRTGTNEATNRRNLLTQRFIAVGALIASGARAASPAFPLNLEQNQRTGDSR